jgi:hypothetical protein
MDIHCHGAADAIATLLLRLDATNPVREGPWEKIEALGATPVCLLTLPGVGTISAVSLFAETAPISTFTGPISWSLSQDLTPPFSRAVNTMPRAATSANAAHPTSAAPSG